jgi:adenylate kinase family enzyme
MSFPAATKIIVVGSSGSGKTTLAKHLAATRNLPFYDLDDFYWLPNWTLRDKEEFRQLIDETTSQESWVISGNQSTYRDLLWPRADLIIWLDVPLPTCLWRVTKRWAWHYFTQTPLCNGNYDSLGSLFSRNSIFYWVVRFHWKRKKEYEEVFKEAGKFLRIKKSLE